METDAERISFSDSLYQITEQMTQTDTEQLKFLCSDYIPIGSLENMDISDLLQTLLERKLIRNKSIDFLTECLILIGRLDIVDHLGCDQEKIEKSSSNLKNYKSTAGLNSFKILLFHLADELTKNEVKKMILYLGGTLQVTKGKLKACSTGFELMTFLIKCHFIHPSKIHNLFDMTQRLQRTDLTEKIKLYEVEHLSNYTATRKPEKIEHLSNYTATRKPEESDDEPIKADITSESYWNQLINRVPSESRYSFCTSLDISSKKYALFEEQLGKVLSAKYNDGLITLSQVEKALKEINLKLPASSVVQSSPKIGNSLGKYEMTARPRGICLIFNNKEFPGSNLTPRKGSDVDRDTLMKLFEKFHFEIILAENSTKEEMMTKLSEVASRDHKQYNCFVCFVLSHGKENIIYGADGRDLPYKALTAPFKPSSCKSLTGKPKLFFIQACQGKTYQEGEQVWEIDGPSRSIPNEADFLMACATVEGYVSFRSKKKGSWFIQNLCKVFTENAERFDLNDMLLMVNESVSKLEGKMDEKMYKQVSAPLSTLRKKIFFLEDSD